MVDPFTAIGTTSAVLGLAKTAWKVGSALVKLYHDTKCVDETVKRLCGEVKSLAYECDLVYAELKDVVKASETGEASPYDLDGRLWRCLATKVEECTETIQTLSNLIGEVSDKSEDFLGQAQRQMRLNKKQDELQRIRERVRAHTDGLRTTLLVVNVKIAHVAPGNANRELLEKLNTLQGMVEALQTSSKGEPRAGLSDNDATLVQYAREVITQGSTIYEASQDAPSVLGGQGASSNNIRVAQWVGTIDALRRDAPLSSHSDTRSFLPSVVSGDDGFRSVTDATSAQYESAQRITEEDTGSSESEDDFAVELAQVALTTGNQEFESSNWQEADTLLQETLRQVKQLPRDKRGFCDTFEIQYQLAICAYHIQEPTDAEAALSSLTQQVASSDTQRRRVCEAEHLLSVLFIRMGQLERAKLSCHRAHQARRRGFGKLDNDTLTSLALMARIYQLLGDTTKSRLYLTMIPEDRKRTISQSVDESLNTRAGPPDDSRPTDNSSQEYVNLEQASDMHNLTQSPSMSGDAASSPTIVPSLLTEIHPVTTPTREGEGTQIRHISNSPETAVLAQGNAVDLPEVTISDQPTEVLTSSDPGTLSGAVDSSTHPGLEQANSISTIAENLRHLKLKPKSPLCKAIYYGTQKDNLDELVKAHFSAASRPRRYFNFGEDAPPLHYAALCGDIVAARSIIAYDEEQIGVKTNKIDISFHYPIQCAFYSLQPEILDLFLSTRPSVIEQLRRGGSFDREELDFMCKCERSFPRSFIAVIEMLLKHGFSVNERIDRFGYTLLHLVAYLGPRLDPDGVAATILCERGANPQLENRFGKSPYTYAAQRNNQTALKIFMKYIPESHTEGASANVNKGQTPQEHHASPRP